LNNFEPQYTILSSKYLGEKLAFIKNKRQPRQEAKEKRNSKFQRIFNLFKWTTKT